MSLNVLVTDDSAVMRKIICKTLKLSGIPLGEIYEAANGQEGLDVLNDNWVDLVLVDINMPVMDGEEMIQHIRENPETLELPIIVVSTEGSQTRIDRLEQRGAKFIHKPFSPELVLEIVQQALGAKL